MERPAAEARPPTEGIMTSTLTRGYLPTDADIRQAAESEIATIGGSVHNVHQDEDRLIIRAVFERSAFVRPGDSLQGGVALRTEGPFIYVHPYTLRQVCTNGAIATHVAGTAILDRPLVEVAVASTYDSAVVLNSVRAAIQACADPGAFATIIRELREASAMEVDTTQNALDLMSCFPAHFAARALSRVMTTYEAQSDRTVYGLMNAITSVARRTRNPVQRWELEEMGGTLPARIARSRARLPKRTLISA
jgi:hypothetical protein